jgi:glycosyltransferase involved in cell wall biosynthesis
MSPRVVHIVPALFANGDGVIGGAERYVYELARHMAGLVPTSLVTFGPRDRDEQAGELRIRVIGRPWHVRGQRANPFALRVIPEVARATIVHCHQQHVLASTVSAIAGRVAGRQVFCTDLGGGGWDLSAFVSTDRLFTGHLHISEYSRKIAGHGADTRTQVILGGVDTTKFNPGSSTTRSGVVFVGRILPHKGVDVLIRALPDGMPARIIGPAPHERYLADVKALATGKAVTFHHNLDDRALVDAYQSATCVVLPSVYDDCYGNHTDVPELLGQTLIEGMACGAPAVCTNVASMPEIVKDGVTGYVRPPNDPAALQQALLCLTANPARAQHMGAAAASDVSARFTWPAVVRRCLHAYGLQTRGPS